MFIKVSALVAILASSALAVPAPSTHVLHEKREVESPAFRRWSKRATVPESRLLPVRIGLAQQNIENGHDMLMEV